MAFLRVADKWQFESQRKYALSILKHQASPAERIAIARTYDEVRNWLVPAFLEMAKGGPPSEKDAQLLGVGDLLNLWYIQAYRRAWNHQNHVDRYVTYLVLEGGDKSRFPTDVKAVTLL